MGTKNNEALQKLQEKSPILRKKTKKLLLKIEKKERRKKKTKTFSQISIVDEAVASVESEQADQSSSSKGNVFTRKITNYVRKY